MWRNTLRWQKPEWTQQKSANCTCFSNDIDIRIIYFASNFDVFICRHKTLHGSLVLDRANYRGEEQFDPTTAAGQA